VEIEYINDESRYIRDSFSVVLSNGWIGLVLVLILLTIFLNLRTAFWVAMGIPVAFLGTIFLLPRFDSYLDTITLSGMILMIGIIVDDAIIVAENISRRRERGEAPLEAAVEGVREVRAPLAGPEHAAGPAQRLPPAPLLAPERRPLPMPLLSDLCAPSFSPIRGR